ncbi:MAG: ABC transporter ATP-binding protein/permease, partial [Candidatus Obscuribacterales bacterium]|nr:ABC transporter ATP-binding protein/permease [Candidatus Obscuribacterales bacterium]
KDVFECMRLANANMPLLFVAAASSAIVVLVNLGIISLLFPLAEGLIKQDFTQLSGGVVQTLRSHLPTDHQDSTSVFCVLLVSIFAFVVLKALLSYILRLVISTQAEAASAGILVKLVARYMSFGKMYHDNTSNERVNSDMSRCKAWIVHQMTGFHSLLSSLLMLCFYLILMAAISWQLTLSLALFLPPIVLTIRYFVARLERIARDRTRSNDDLRIKTGELIKRVNLVQHSGKAERELSVIEGLANTKFSISKSYQRLNSLIEPLQEVGTTSAQLALAWMLALVTSASSLSSALPPSHVFVFFYLSSKVIPLFNLLNQFRTRLASDAGGMEILHSFLCDDGKHIIASGTETFSGINDSIIFEDLRFSYKPGVPVFDSLDFQVKAGLITAVVGETGAGKTTIAQLLLRLYECDPGHILLDGVDIQQFSLPSVRSKIAFVPQDPMIFDDTLRANLCYELDSKPTSSELARVLEITQLANLVESLPDGMESLIGDKGTQLSAGQRQRIAIARALLKNAPILILDEATAALDPRTEDLVMKALLEEMRGKTVLLTSHRLSTVGYADCIYVLQGHQIAQFGTLAELTAEDGPFTRCFNIQKGAIMMS